VYRGSKDASVAEYALQGLPNKVVAAEYQTALPSATVLAARIDVRARSCLLGSRSDGGTTRGLTVGAPGPT
jgi:hypothetical protein